MVVESEEARIGRPVIFGEVLFDQFENGNAVLGGAPFNVSWHLHGFGLQPLLISRIGRDPCGEQLLDAMASWGMDCRGMQIDPSRKTGIVKVSVVDGQPSYNIMPDQAYDHIDASQALALLENESCGLLYHGTLVARSGTSRETLSQIRKQTQLPTFVDINLRSPWWDHPLVWQAFRGARWVKLNDEEIDRVNEDETLAGKAVEDIAFHLREKFQFDLLIATLGAKGSFFIDDAGQHKGAPVSVANLVDTVGAGDAFSAVTIYGLSKGWHVEDIQKRALEFAATMCGVQGATINDHDLYKIYSDKWNR